MLHVKNLQKHAPAFPSDSSTLLFPPCQGFSKHTAPSHRRQCLFRPRRSMRVTSRCSLGRESYSNSYSSSEVANVSPRTPIDSISHALSRRIRRPIRSPKVQQRVALRILVRQLIKFQHETVSLLHEPLSRSVAVGIFDAERVAGALAPIPPLRADCELNDARFRGARGWIVRVLFASSASPFGSHASPRRRASDVSTTPYPASSSPVSASRVCCSGTSAYFSRQ